MAEEGLPLLVHCEVTDPDVDLFDRESVFLDTVLGPLLEAHPTLRAVVEHATTAEAVAFVRSYANRVGCTLTPQHLLLNRNALFAGGLRPHHYCLPVLKRERHRLALIDAATSGDPRFFLGTDSAPHARGAKESACGCAGCFSAPHALPLYATAFEAVGALHALEAFASHHGPDWYRLPRNTQSITLVRSETPVPESHAFAGSEVVPLLAGTTLPWRLEAP
jgi:dihydroorotase